MINVAIDGPAGAGKSTIARIVAKKKKYIYVDTGAMYRAMALACLRLGLKAEEKEKITEVCEGADVRLEYVDGEQHVLLNGENVNDYIRTEEVSRMTSAVSAYGEVRDKLLKLQRNIAENNNVIMDGRDIGSNVLPDAQVKIYLTASVHVRALRRYYEYKGKGYEVKIEDIEKDIEERDYRDSHRQYAPLMVAEGAIVIDTSDMEPDEVVNKVIEYINNVEE